MCTIDVYLTTTKWTHISKIEDIDIANMDVPVCVAKMGMGMFGFNLHDKEESEHKWSDVCKIMAQHVVVDVVNRSIYIGEYEHFIPNAALVEFQSQSKSAYSDNFFKRWTETKTLLFEFTVIDLSSQQPSFCLRGLWINNSWQSLNVVPTNNLTIIDTTNCR